MYFWLYYEVWILQAYVLALYVDSVLTLRIRINKYLAAFLCTVFYMITSYFKLRTSGTDMHPGYHLANVAGILGIIYYIVLMHRDRMRNKIICIVMYYALMFLSASVMSLLIYEKDSSFIVDFDSIIDLEKFAVTNMASVVFIIFGTILYNFYINKRLIKKINFGMCILAVSQIITLKFLWSAEFIENYMAVNIISMVGLFIGYLSDILLFFIIESESEQENLQREIRTVRQAMELESIRYEVLCEKRQELANLRHDYNNQLVVVQLLLDGGNEKEAQDIISGLRSLVNTGK